METVIHKAIRAHQENNLEEAEKLYKIKENYNLRQN